jgi:hypothetical protein
VFATASAPSAASFSLTSGNCTILAISLCSRLTTWD